VAENVTPLHRWLVTVEEVKVGPTDGAGGDLDDRIAGDAVSWDPEQYLLGRRLFRASIARA
jgi:hypothetical protein